MWDKDSHLPDLSSARRHHEVELLVVDLAVAVDVDVVDEALDLVLVKLLAQVLEGRGQFFQFIMIIDI